jgi:type IV secretory pathway TrbF-like protein
MGSGIQVVVDVSKRGFTIRWFEQGLERHVWVAQSRFEELLASGETVYVDTPAIAAERLM